MTDGHMEQASAEQSNLGFWIEKMFAEKEATIQRLTAEVEQWRMHAAKWESVARNCATPLAFAVETQDVFRNQCAIEGLTP